MLFRSHLISLIHEKRTMVFYEAPHKLSATLRDMLQYLGDRRISIVRELTKVHEEVIRTTLAEAVKSYADDSIKGEIVLVIEGSNEAETSDSTLEDAVRTARELADTGLSLSDAAKESAKLTGFKKGDIYKQLLSK